MPGEYHAVPKGEKPNHTLETHCLCCPELLTGAAADGDLVVVYRHNQLGPFVPTSQWQEDEERWRAAHPNAGWFRRLLHWIWDAAG